MINFSDETVEKVRKAIEDAAPNYWNYPQAALSSLTLADLMQVDEVRELVTLLEDIDSVAYCAGLDEVLRAQITRAINKPKEAK